MENFGDFAPSRNQIMSMKVGKTSLSQFGTISERTDNNNYDMQMHLQQKQQALMMGSFD